MSRNARAGGLQDEDRCKFFEWLRVTQEKAVFFPAGAAMLEYRKEKLRASRMAPLNNELVRSEVAIKITEFGDWPSDTAYILGRTRQLLQEKLDGL